MNHLAERRAEARQIFLEALQAASIAKAFARNVEYTRGVLRVGDVLYALDQFSRLQVIAMGKAAHPMVEALAGQLGTLATGIVVSPVEPANQVTGYRYYHGGHPLPNAESVRAANAILQSLGTASPRPLVIYLISGGASAAVEKPVDEAITLDDLVTTYHALVLSGAPIAEINAIRKHLSGVKGGRMAVAAASAGKAQQVSIMVSDVPDGAPDSLGSGPTTPDSTTAGDCYAIEQRHRLREQFPAAVRELFEKRALAETPKSDDPAFIQAHWWTILSNATAVKAAAHSAARLGYFVGEDNSCDDWDYARAADYLLERVRALRRPGKPVCLVSGGEVTVKVASGAGTGGRNQQFALYCAERIAGEEITVLSCGTDGIDGNSAAAGAVADGTTMARAKEKGFDVTGSLARFDAFPLFSALGDSIVTGPTGNNIRDLRILLAR